MNEHDASKPEGEMGPGAEAFANMGKPEQAPQPEPAPEAPAPVDEELAKLNSELPEGSGREFIRDPDSGIIGSVVKQNRPNRWK